VKIGCAMFTMLLANSEGRAFLTDSKLLREIAMKLEALDPVIPKLDTSNPYSKHGIMTNPFSQYKLSRTP